MRMTIPGSCLPHRKKMNISSSHRTSVKLAWPHYKIIAPQSALGFDPDWDTLEGDTTAPVALTTSDVFTEPKDKNLCTIK